ncbi:hypothetical protein MTBBW1_1610009 [Desulfamplus magnetovallimortis]|uniref:Uncharacterized protein n=1 Tax=Desulfamplus magnetovallimortis TaxID=1246637 RepID=A0A1W1H8N8_9BACT|nr:hypothetical protein MTBBW1_1610009 [Desulfamplus magnetovallimortis]
MPELILIISEGLWLKKRFGILTGSLNFDRLLNCYRKFFVLFKTVFWKKYGAIFLGG